MRLVEELFPPNPVSIVENKAWIDNGIVSSTHSHHSEQITDVL